MATNETIKEWEDKHFSILSEYSKGNANNEVMQMYRSRMKDITDFINYLKQNEPKRSLGDLNDTELEGLAKIHLANIRIEHVEKIIIKNRIVAGNRTRGFAFEVYTKERHGAMMEIYYLKFFPNEFLYLQNLGVKF